MAKINGPPNSGKHMHSSGIMQGDENSANGQNAGSNSEYNGGANLFPRRASTGTNGKAR